ncbi:MAG: crAss001_48 related protein [Terrisporobacter sp.]|uniref:crAss001_48 related protein n=1 Tax=Terrisporobacter sp. TaxID=1965305 RepID=UPI003999F7A6
MKLQDIIEMMNSADYNERFKAEFYQLKIRICKLDNMVSKYKLGELPFEPNCSYDLLNGQLKAMRLYQSYLIERAEIENVEIDTTLMG